MKDKFIFFIGIFIVIWSFYAFLQKPAPLKYQPSEIGHPQGELEGGEVSGEGKLMFDDKTIFVETADTEDARRIGLSGRESLESGHGLLFFFHRNGKYGFWMKNMHFPIDIIWIDENWVVAQVSREISPQTYPKIFYPTKPIKHVLELPSDEASRLGIDIGTQMIFDTRI